MKSKFYVTVIAAFLSFTSINAKNECKQELKDFCQGVTKGDKETLATCFSWKEDSGDSDFSEACKMKLASEREKNGKLMAVCAADREKLCPAEKPGKGQAMRCLKKRVTELSEECKTAIDKTPVKMK